MGKHKQDYRAENENVIDEHARKVKELFHSALSEELWVCIDELNEELWQEDGRQRREQEGPYKVAKLSVLTRSMLEYDRSYFSESPNTNIESYRPYFYNFIIYVDSSDDCAAYDRLQEMGDKWFKASFSKITSEEWHEYKGEIERSASPVTYQERKIYISDKSLTPDIIEEINETYSVIAPPTPDKDIEAQLTSLLHDVKFESARVYNVGNGNLINIVGSKNSQTFNLVFDVGYHSRQDPNDVRSIYGAAIRSFEYVIPDVVCLSHWDDDHIMGCSYRRTYGRNELFDCPWIAPEIVKKNATSAKRLAAYLTKKHKLIVIKRERIARRFARIITSNSTVSFFLGENKRKQTITQENCGGMVIEIVTQAFPNMAVVENLFCGDVPYEAIKTEIWNKRVDGYDNLLVPHHGSAMVCTSLKTKKSAMAVVCGTGTGNRPHDNHRTTLEASGMGYHVEVTADAKIHPWIDLII